MRYPDFTVDDAETGRRVLIEHLGMLDRPDYAERWERKLAWYRAAGVRPHDEGEAAVALLTESLIKADRAPIRRSFSASSRKPPLRLSGTKGRSLNACPGVPDGREARRPNST